MITNLARFALLPLILLFSLNALPMKAQVAPTLEKPVQPVAVDTGTVRPYDTAVCDRKSHDFDTRQWSTFDCYNASLVKD